MRDPLVQKGTDGKEPMAGPTWKRGGQVGQAALLPCLSSPCPKPGDLRNLLGRGAGWSPHILIITKDFRPATGLGREGGKFSL